MLSTQFSRRLAVARSYGRYSIRSAHTWPASQQGLAKVLEKKPDDVVITLALRTAMGRAKKGQLKDTPVDAMLAAVFQASTML